EELIDPLSEHLDNETMAELNARVDVDGEEPADVAWDYLVEEGFITEARLIMSAIVAAYGTVDPDQAERMLSRLKHRGRGGQASHQMLHAWLGTCYASTDSSNSDAILQPTAGTWLIGDGVTENYRHVWEQLIAGRFSL